MMSFKGGRAKADTKADHQRSALCRQGMHRPCRIHRARGDTDDGVTTCRCPCHTQEVQCN